MKPLQLLLIIVADLMQTKRNEKNAPQAPQWTVVHSFYSGMGGFVFDLTDVESGDCPSFIPGSSRLHVTSRGMRLLAQCGLLPSISKSEIEDKSKSDGSAKFICCIQVVWIVAQTITRLAVGLSVSPLEINTIGHVACALMMYALWWSKPRWIREPTVLRGEWVHEICAFMYMSSQVSSERQPQRDVLRNFGVKTELAGLLYIVENDDTPSRSGSSTAGSDSTSFMEHGRLQSRHDRGSQPDAISKQPRVSTCSELSQQTLSEGYAGPTSQAPKDVALEAMRRARWKYCCQALQKYPALRDRLKHRERTAAQLRFREALQLYPGMPREVQQLFEDAHLEDAAVATCDKIEWVCSSEELVVDRPRDWPGDDLILHMQGHLMGVILWCASTIYGAIHLAGWNEHFPTIIESWFWRGSAAYIVLSGLLWSTFNLLGHLSPTIWLYWYNLLAAEVRKKSHVLVYILSGIGGTLYVVARIYLVAESFISLRALPRSAYDSPSWVLTVPHLS
jgi:hypothetical protein